MARLSAFLPLVLFALLVAALLAGLKHSESNPAPNRFAQHVGDPAPLAKIGAFDPARWKGKPYIVHFFASWCVPCRAEHDDMAMLHAQKIPMIGVAFKDKPENIKKFLAHDKNPFALSAYDPEGRGGIEWGLTGVPETFLIDKNGTIRLHIAGPLTDTAVAHDIIPLWREMAHD